LFEYLASRHTILEIALEDAHVFEQLFIDSLRTGAANTMESLSQELLRELRDYFSVDSTISDDELLKRIQQSTEGLKQEWLDKGIDGKDPASLLKFYSETQKYCFELIGLDISATPHRMMQLAEFSRFLKTRNKRRGLDFGSGIGSTGIYLIRNGAECDFADVSDINLGFIRRSLKNRNLSGQTFLLPNASIPTATYDFVLAMDVLEHVLDPLTTLRQLRSYLKPDGVLIFNLITNSENTDPLHIMNDQYLIRKHIRGFGFNKIGTIGEFKVYQRTNRTKLVDLIFRLADTVFWNLRSAVKGR